MMITRRDLLRRGLLAAPAAALLPSFLTRSLLAATGSGPKNLVFVELRGGNDALNTVVPFGLNDGAYYLQYRDKLSVRQDALWPLDEFHGLHPGLAAWKPLFDEGQLAILNGVGLPNPIQSHMVAQRIWASGDPTAADGDGWFGRWLSQFGGGSTGSDPQAFDVASVAGRIFGGGGFVPAFRALNDLEFPIDGRFKSDGANRRAAFKAIAQGTKAQGGDFGKVGGDQLKLLKVMDELKDVKAKKGVLSYPDHPFGRELKLVASLLRSGLGYRYFHVTLLSFDTHSNEVDKRLHEKLIRLVGDGTAALQSEIAAAGLGQDTLIVVYSEFGRSMYENGSGGTDHGTAGSTFVIGSAVKGGMITPYPSLDPGDLSPDKEMIATTDFRDVFGTIVDHWLNTTPSKVFKNHAYTDLGFL